jgi:HK97 gp10 family phage protein
MSAISGKVGDISKLLNKLTGAAPILQKATREALAKSALEIHKNAVKSIAKSSKGERQKRYNPERTVRVSNEGDAPNNDTGRLIQSIKFEVEEDAAYVGSNLKYAAWLEFGTEKMAARPWLAPALQNASEKVAQFMQDALNSGLKKSLGVTGVVTNFNNLSKSISRSVTKK